MTQCTTAIAILLATYNGETYLASQLDSLLSQSYGNWHLYVHDDGSTDATPTILHRYAVMYPRQVTLLDYPAQGGAYANFMSLLQRVEAPYYMFCDQDDVWHREKIALTMAAMKQAEHGGQWRPVVVHTDLRVVDGNGLQLAPSFWQQAGIRPNLFHTFAQRISNVVTGCTMLFNQPARAAALRRRPACCPLHDEWVTIRCCAEGGTVVPLFQQTIDYRQHTGNTLGAEACYQQKTAAYYLTNIRRIWCQNRDNYRVLRSAGYGSPLTYLLNKLRLILVYHFNIRCL